MPGTPLGEELRAACIILALALVALGEQGTRCGKNRIARIVKDNGIRAEVKMRFRKTTDSKHNYSLAANLLIQDGYKGPLWAPDITFVPTNEGWLYVSGHEGEDSKDHWAVHEGPTDGGTGSYSAKAGRDERETARGFDPSFRLRQAICELWISGVSEALRYNAQHEQKRQLLRSALGYKSPELYEKSLKET